MQSRDYEKELIIHASEPEFDKVYNRVKGFLQFETKLTKLKLDLTEHKIRKILKNFEKDPRFWEFFTLSQKVLNIKEIDIAKLKKETFDLKDANSFLENENSQLKQKIDSLMQSSSKMEHSLNSEIIKLNAKLESSNSGIADLEKALKSSKKEKNKKIQESFSKVLEKDQIIAKLNSDILLKDQLLKERELKISELQLNIRKILNFQNDASQPLVTQLIEHKMESPENEISKYFDVQDDNRLHHIFSCRNIRHRILSFLDLQSILKLKSSSFMIYKFISLDSKSIEFIVRSIEDSYKKRIGILNNSLNYFYKRINSSSDDYISFVLHKHLTLKYGFMDSIQSSIMNSAGIIYKIKKEYEAQEEIKIDEDLRIIDQAKSQGNDLHQQEKPDLESQLDPKIDIAKVQTRAPVKKDSLGFISTLAGTSVKDYTSFFGKMINEENEFGRNEKQLSDFYDQHLELFKRVGIMYSKGENFEERMSNRKVQQETFEDTIVKSAVALLHSLQNYTKEESYNNFILPFCRVSIFSSLFLQEVKVS